MKVFRRVSGTDVYFVLADLEPKYRQAARDLAFSETEEGFSRGFPADTRELDRIFENFERHAEQMILQAARVWPVPWEDALLAFLRRIERQDIDWWLVGSASLAVRGLDVAPRDVDIVVDAAGARRLGDLLLDSLVEPIQPVSGWIARWFGRAFLHARIEWIAEVEEDVDRHGPRPFGPAGLAGRHVVQWLGRDIRVPPLELQLQDDEKRGLKRVMPARVAVGLPQGPTRPIGQDVTTDGGI